MSFQTGFNIPSIFNWNENDFDEKMFEQFKSINRVAKEFAEHIEGICPNTEEKAIALRNIQNTVLWACESIRVHGRKNEVTAKVNVEAKQFCGNSSTRAVIENFVMQMKSTGLNPAAIYRVRDVLHKEILGEQI